MDYERSVGGLDLSRKNRLIGVELTFQAPSGNTEELEMFVPKRDILLPGYAEHWKGMAIVTLHLSNGDRQMRIQL